MITYKNCNMRRTRRDVRDSEAGDDGMVTGSATSRTRRDVRDSEAGGNLKRNVVVFGRTRRDVRDSEAEYSHRTVAAKLWSHTP